MAGICFFAVMALVLLNIIMRNVFGQPLAGTYDLVGLLIATGLGLALANCAINDGNIAMSIITDRLSLYKQRIIEIVVNVIALGFWAMVVWRIFVYASASFSNGRVSSTASIPIYPFIILLGLNVICLCTVIVFNLSASIKGVATMPRRLASAEKKVSK